MAFPVARHMRVEMRLYGPEGATAGMLFYYTDTDGLLPDIGSMPASAEFFYDTLGPPIAACMVPGTGVLQAICTFNSGSLQLDAVSTGTALPGTQTAGDILPEEDAIVLQKRTGLQGRNKRGRWFLPYVPEDFQENGELNATAFTALGPLAEVLRADQVDPIGPTTWNPVLADSKTGVWEDIRDVRIVRQVCNKRGRRDPKRLTVTAMPF